MSLMGLEVAGFGAGVPSVGRAALFLTIWQAVQSGPVATSGWDHRSPPLSAVARAGGAPSSWRWRTETHRKLICARSTKHAAQIRAGRTLTLPRIIRNFT